MSRVSLLIVSVALLSLAGCSGGGEKGGEAKAGEANAKEGAAKEGAAKEGAAKGRVVPMPSAPLLERRTDGQVTVTAAGGKIAPPARKSDIPDGAWICDMGTVHYARAEKGDGKCPLCGMNLVQHKAAPAEAAPGKPAAADPAVAPKSPTETEAHDHEGHDH